jgi:hypothetical protein
MNERHDFLFYNTYWRSDRSFKVTGLNRYRQSLERIIDFDLGYHSGGSQ